jgi:hypothetical protein
MSLPSVWAEPACFTGESNMGNYVPSIADDALIQDCFDVLQRSLHKFGLDIEFANDMNGWVDTIKSAPKRGVVNPTFDPAESDLSPSNSFWIRVYEADGDEERTIACIANRVFETPDYLDLLRTQRLWYSWGPRRVVDLVVPYEMPLISGLVGHHGGLWIHPEWRKHGLSGYLTKMVRCVSLRHFGIDWHCGSVFGVIAEKGLPTASVTGYGYPHMVLAIDGWFPVTDRDECVYLPWISRAEILEQFGQELDRLVADRDQQPIGLSIVS